MAAVLAAGQPAIAAPEWGFDQPGFQTRKSIQLPGSADITTSAAAPVIVVQSTEAGEAFLPIEAYANKESITVKLRYVESTSTLSFAWYDDGFTGYGVRRYRVSSNPPYQLEEQVYYSNWSAWTAVCGLASRLYCKGAHYHKYMISPLGIIVIRESSAPAFVPWGG